MAKKEQLKIRYSESQTLKYKNLVDLSVPIIWILQDTAGPVVQDDPASHLAAIYGVGARRAHPAGAP